MWQCQKLCLYCPSRDFFLLIDPYELVDGKLDCYVNFYLLEPCSIINGRVER